MTTLALLVTALLPGQPAGVRSIDFTPWMPEIVRWESEIKKFEELDRAQADPEGAILFVGSSSIRLWDTIAQDMAPYPVIRRGYGGAKFSDVAYYAKRLVLPHKFRALVLFVGNDVSGSANDRTPQQVADCFSHIVNVVREQHPEVPIVCLDVRPTASRWNAWPQIQAANRALSNVCDQDPHSYYVATSEHFLDDNGQPREDLLRQDRLHLSESGYKLWTKLIRSALDDVLESSDLPPARTRKILLIGQQRDHPPQSHEYMAGLGVLQQMLKDIPELELKIAKADEPWTDGHKMLEDVDGLVLYLGQGGRWIQQDPQRLAAMRRLAAGKAGIVALHWAIGAKDAQFISPYREMIGGVHGGDDRKYVVSSNELVVQDLQHPIMHEVEDLTIKDEWYYRLKFSPVGKVQPLMAARIDGQDETVAWAYERVGGGKSFGFSGLHFHDNWKCEDLRRMVAQAILWSVDLPVDHPQLSIELPDEVYALPGN